MQLVLIAPALLALPADRLAALRSLAALARYAAAPQVEPRGIAAALLAALGAARTAPVAPLALLGAGADPRDDYVLCADPVHLVADRDTVVLVQRIDDLPAGDAGVLVRMLDRHFADDDLRFEAVRSDAWFARRRQAPEIVTTPLDAALRRPVFDHLPRGADAGRWRRWQNEIEMLLHEHEVNASREARGESVVSGIWFWGGGRMADVGVLPPLAASVAPGRLGDLARGIARHAGGIATALRADETLAPTVQHAAALSANGNAFALVVLPPSAEDAATLETNWLAPALELLARRDVAALHLIVDGNGAAVTWVAHPPTLWRRMSTRLGGRRFEAPQALDA